MTVKPWTSYKVIGNWVYPVMRDGLMGPRFDDYADAVGWADDRNREATMDYDTQLQTGDPAQEDDPVCEVCGDDVVAVSVDTDGLCLSCFYDGEGGEMPDSPSLQDDGVYFPSYGE